MEGTTLKPDVTTSQNLASAALDSTTTYNRKFRLEKILIRFSVSVTETITITLDSINGTTYDIILRSRGLSSEQNFVYEPEGEANYQKGDEIRIQCTNANKTGIAYVTVKTREVLS